MANMCDVKIVIKSFNSEGFIDFDNFLDKRLKDSNNLYLGLERYLFDVDRYSNFGYLEIGINGFVKWALDDSEVSEFIRILKFIHPAVMSAELTLNESGFALYGKYSYNAAEDKLEYSVLPTKHYPVVEDPDALAAALEDAFEEHKVTYEITL